MPRRMRISRAGIELIKSFEGFQSRTVRVDEEHWVIGYGHVRKSKDKYRVSRDEAEQILREYDLPSFEALVLENTYSPLHQSAFDALVSFAFNIGKENFLGSDVLALLNSGETIAAAEAIGAWRKAKIEGRTIIVDALVRRRAAEKAMFLAHPSGPAPAPSAMVRPKMDVSASVMTPGERAVVIETAVNGDEATAVAREPEEERRTPRKPAVAEAVQSDRLTRRFEEILGEEELPHPPNVPANDMGTGPTPEEITAAISELVNGSNSEAELHDVEDLPGFDLDPLDSDDQEPLDFDPIELEPIDDDEFVTLEDARAGRRFERTLGETVKPDQSSQKSAPPIIDDLETVEIADEDIQRAMDLHNEMASETIGTSIREWAPFALLAAIGAGLIGWGLTKFIRDDRSFAQAEVSSDLVLTIVGALLFVVMVYYFVREFTRPSDD